MLNIINEELMAYSTMDITEKGKNFTKIRVATSNNLQQYESNSRYNKTEVRSEAKFERKANSGPKVKVGIDSNIDELKPINREIIRISAPLHVINEFEDQPIDAKSVEFDLPMTINVNSTNKYQPRVEVRCHDQGDDRANLYVVAFPFNGMIKPIPENPQYRIYKGLIASSAKPFFFNGRKYRKVLYLVIEVNKNLFNEDHKYHTDTIDIKLESYALFEDKETGEKKTNCEVFNLSILSADGDYVATWDYSVADEPIMMTAEPGQQLWVTFDFEAYKAKNQRNYNNDPGKRISNPKKKHFTVEGDVMVTTNRHGIRKEISINGNRKRYNKSYEDNNYIPHSSKNMSIDQMMAESGMFDNDYDNRGRKNGGKRKGSNKKR